MTARAPSSCLCCVHFSQDAPAIEAALLNLTSLSSAYAAVRSNDGLCGVHERYVAASSVCDSYTASTCTRQS
jgi:hypothetical protein